MKARKHRRPQKGELRPPGLRETKLDGQSKTAERLPASAGWRRAEAVTLLLFALIFGGFSIASFQQKSPTVDEPVHLLSGYAALKWGDFRVNPEHPPLAKMLAAIPLLFLDIKDPRRSAPEWDLIPERGPTELRTVSVAARMLFVDNDAEALFFYAKLMMIGMAALLGLFVYKWSKDLFGLGAAMASLFIYAFDPNVLAHSRLIHTDLPFTAVFFIGTYYFWRAITCLRLADLLLSWFFFGLAAITKFAYPAMFLVWGALGLARICSIAPLEVRMGTPKRIDGRWPKTRYILLVFAGALAAAYVFIWAAYEFRFDAIPGGNMRLAIEQELSQLSYGDAVFSYLLQHRLFPEAWLYGQIYVLNRLSRTSYLLGQISTGGSWLYFPIAFAVKTPVPTLLLILGAAALCCYNHRRRANSSFFLIAPAVYFLLAMASGINIGLRHILPVYPFLFVVCGKGAQALWRSERFAPRAALFALLSWLCLSSVTTFPHYLAFFNELAGGPKNGHKILLESNLDWGQDLKGLKRWMDGRGVKQIQFLYFGIHDARAPKYYGIEAVYLPGSWVADADISTQPESPRPALLAISANHLSQYLLPRGERTVVQSLQRVEPIASIGYSIVVYDVNAAMEQFRGLIRARPDAAENYYFLANLLWHQGMASEAVENYRDALRLNPRYAEAHHKLGLVLATAGEPGEAMTHFQRALEGDGPAELRSESRYYLATILAKLGRFAEAAEHLQEVVKAEPNFPRAYHRLGVVFLAEGNVEGAIAYFKRALALDSQYADAHLDLGRALALQGKTDEAREHLEEALRILKTASATNVGSKTDEPLSR